MSVYIVPILVLALFFFFRPLLRENLHNGLKCNKSYTGEEIKECMCKIKIF